MSNDVRGPVEGILLRRIPSDDGVTTYELLPSVGRLLNRPGFGARNPICLPGTPRPLDGWSIFGEPRPLLH